MSARRLLAGVVLAGLILALAIATAPAHAGQTCEQKAPDTQALTRGLALAGKVEQHLKGSGADVVVIARVGQDLREYGQRYSHLGFAYRDGDVWRVVHKLNECGTDTSAIFRQGLGEFFLDDPFDYEAGIVVPKPEVQAHLLAVLRDNGRLSRLHTPEYSMLAYAWGKKYQQSNQWAIETLAMAEDGDASNRSRAQSWLNLKGYQPGTIHLSTFQRLGARVTQANIAFDDHPDKYRYSGRIYTVTADSVFLWLERSGLGSRPIAIR
ncbi:DUF2145 domain-containing protein [Piscinibacter gummiphilus]|uniref:Uncharacterized protein n=1 Tax=Piscinibacter gummiphilus TaxID=946333 RepID=A0A1W6LH83_9BURK|nr:DUF2145 domain-containing protein [Piscinibacter gummiphilus]ARN23573.1 hypothetical protein A4W93_28795 [Piscinibacter gummiphilus]ATU68281.1 DUF2145 domain-containing protein [Piscinibacter gummiphilus]GLS98168.1 hypothetical protein GCM10007918_54600 [Piscinibacter gummiphilus]